MARVILYSHDTFGLGHFRRCLKLAACLAGSDERFEGALLTGSPWSSLFALPPGFQAIRLPPVVKCGPRRYTSREGSVSFAAVAAERRTIIQRTIEDLAPDLLIVDNVPCGLAGEVLPALRTLKKRRRARAVLSLRDVLDSPEVILSEWSDSGADEAIQMLFDEIWVFGDSSDVAMLVEEGPLAPAAEKVHACGRVGVGRIHHGENPATPAPGRPSVLVTGGGGRDASPLVTTYLEALRNHRPTVTSQLILGPDFPPACRAELSCAGHDRLEVEGFVADLPRRLAVSDVIVAMAGYNTMCEILEAGRPAVVVPRVAPRAEQLIRALRWQKARRVRVIHPDDLDATSLWRAVEELLTGTRPAPQMLYGGQVAAVRASALVRAERGVT